MKLKTRGTAGLACERWAEGMVNSFMLPKKEHNTLWKLDPVWKNFKFKQIHALTLISLSNKDEFVCVSLYTCSFISEAIY